MYFSKYSIILFVHSIRNLLLIDVLPFAGMDRQSEGKASSPEEWFEAEDGENGQLENGWAENVGQANPYANWDPK